MKITSISILTNDIKEQRGRWFYTMDRFFLYGFHCNAPFFPAFMTAIYKSHDKFDKNVYHAVSDDQFKILSFRKIAFEKLNLFSGRLNVGHYIYVKLGDEDILGINFDGSRYCCAKGLENLAKEFLASGNNNDFFSNPLFALSFARVAEDPAKELIFAKLAARRLFNVHPLMAKNWLVSTILSPSAQRAAADIFEGLRGQLAHKADFRREITNLRFADVEVDLKQCDDGIDLYCNVEFFSAIKQDFRFGFGKVYLYIIASKLSNTVRPLLKSISMPLNGNCLSL